MQHGFQRDRYAVLADKVIPRIGRVIGTGGRGTNVFCVNLLAAGYSVFSLSATSVQEKAEHAQSLVVKSGQKSHELNTNGDHAFESLGGVREDADLCGHRDALELACRNGSRDTEAWKTCCRRSAGCHVDRGLLETR